MRAREGDLVEIADGTIFDVKGLVHPVGRIVAFIRFVPNSKGDRKRGGQTYRKVYPLQERYAVLQKRFPQYLVYDDVFGEWLCEVPEKAVERHYRPVDYLRSLRRKSSLDKLESEALQFAELLKETANISWNALGISGSLLAGLSMPTSDIDLIIYGSGNCRKIHDALKSLVAEGENPVKSYSSDELKSLFDFRSKDTIMSFEDFVRTESRKILQGKFVQRDYFIRCVKDWNEVTEQYGTVHYEPLGQAKVKATVTDDSEMIFTPCSYRVHKVKTVAGRQAKLVQQIDSFRGRFCEQAQIGETVIARGKIEGVHRAGEEEFFRLLVGNKPSDYLIPAH